MAAGTKNIWSILVLNICCLYYIEDNTMNIVFKVYTCPLCKA